MLKALYYGPGWWNFVWKDQIKTNKQNAPWKTKKNTCFIKIFFWIHHFHYSFVLCQKWFEFNPHRTGKCSWLLYYYWCYQVCKGSSYAPIDPNKPKLWTNFPNIKNKPRTLGSRFEFQVGLSKLSKVLIENWL